MINESRLTAIRRFITKMALFPLTAITSIFLYPSIITQMFTSRGKGYTRLEEQSGVKALLYLPAYNNEGTRGNSYENFYASVSLLWPFFSLEDYALDIVNKIKALDEEDVDCIQVYGADLGASAAIIAMAYILKKQMTFKHVVYFQFEDALCWIPDTIQRVYRGDSVNSILYILGMVLAAVTTFMVSFVVSIPMASYFASVAMCSAGGVCVTKRVLVKIGEAVDKSKDTIFDSTSLDLLVVTVVTMFALSGSTFMYVPLVMYLLLQENIAAYTMPFILESMGSNVDMMKVIDYVVENQNSGQLKITHVNGRRRNFFGLCSNQLYPLDNQCELERATFGKDNLEFYNKKYRAQEEKLVGENPFSDNDDKLLADFPL